MKENDLPALADSAVVELVPLNEPRGKQRAEQRRRAAFSERTQQQYSSLWRQFLFWWSGYAPDRPPYSVTTEELTWYLAEREQDGRAYATLLADYNAIDFVVRRAGGQSLRRDDVVAEFLSGYRREERPRQAQKTAIMPDMLNAMVESIDDSPIGLRNRALLLVGWCSGQRREELVRMSPENLLLDHEMEMPGYRIYIPFSKTDQEGKGRTTMIHIAGDNKPCFCPCASIETWMEAKSPASKETPIFRGFKHQETTRWSLTGHDVARLIKSRCQALGEDPSLYGGHSLRSGFVTYMFSIGKTWQEIAAYTGHTNQAMTDKYNRPHGKKPFSGIR